MSSSIRSMTGYGFGEVARHGIKISVELSVVNRKQFDFNVHLAKPLASFEGRIQEELQKEISRGRINGEVLLSYYGSTRRAAVKVDEDLAAAYIRKLKAAAQHLQLAEKVDVGLLLRLPEVVRLEEPPMDQTDLWGVLNSALGKAIKGVTRMRCEEGRALGKEMLERIAKMNERLTFIKKRAPEVVTRYRTNLFRRLQEVASELASDDGRLLREVAIFAEKADITEEIARLGSHLQQAQSVLRTRDAGRTLDFLAQEMLREINTIGSKANDGTIASMVVYFKTELERFREQAQNIE